MKLSKFILIIYCCVFLPLYAIGQSGTGCLMPDGRIYYTYTGPALIGGTPTYNSSFSSSYASTGACPGRVNYTTTGTSCGIGLIARVIALGGGTEVDYFPCPLDDYLPIFTLIAAGTGAYYIYRKKVYVRA